MSQQLRSLTITELRKSLQKHWLKPRSGSGARLGGKLWAVLFALCVIACSQSGRANATTYSIHTVLLTWDASNTPGVVYRIWRSHNPTPPTNSYTTTSKLDWTDSHVLDGKTYYYWVSAHEISTGLDSDKDGPVSAIVP